MPRSLRTVLASFLMGGAAIVAASACVGDDVVAGSSPPPGGGPEASSGGPGAGDGSPGDASSDATTPPADAPGDGAEPFNPAKTPGLVVWLDGQDDATFTVAAGKVTEWRDKSAASNDAVAVAGAEPQRVANAAVGKPIVRFAGAQALAVADKMSLYFHGTDDFVIAMVAGFSIAPNGGFLAKTNFPASDNGLWLTTFGAGKVCFSINATCGEFPVATETLHRFVARRTAAGTETRIAVDGAEQPARTVAVLDVSNPGKDLLIGASRKDGTTITEALTGDIAEVLVYHPAAGTVMTAAQLAALDSYLASKWGL